MMLLHPFTASIFHSNLFNYGSIFVLWNPMTTVLFSLHSAELYIANRCALRVSGKNLKPRNGAHSHRQAKIEITLVLVFVATSIA